MVDYRIILPNEKAATYRIITLIIALINAAAFGFLFFVISPKLKSNLIDFGFGVSLAALAMYIFTLIRKKKTTLRIEISFLICATVWLVAGQWQVALLLALFAFLGFYANRELQVQFSSAGIGYPTFPPKNIPWTSVKQVLLKDNVLSIDLRNNHFIQHRLDDAVASNLHAPAFNQYCASAILSHAQP